MAKKKKPTVPQRRYVGLAKAMDKKADEVFLAKVDHLKRAGNHGVATTAAQLKLDHELLIAEANYDPTVPFELAPKERVRGMTKNSPIVDFPVSEPDHASDANGNAQGSVAGEVAGPV